MCFVRVVGYNDTRTKKIGSDTSDKLFTIEVVKLTSPNGGPPSLKRDETINITWTAYETTKPITKVQLYYTKDGGTTYNSIITLSGAYPPGDYSQSWTVPPVGTTSKTKCKVKVVLKDAKGVIRGSDVSDNFFTIEPFPPVMVTVPNVVGMTQADAQSVITVAKLIVGTITQANSATVPAGNVISQNPAAGSSVAEGSTVSLVISTGPGMVTVPNVIGMTQARAESAIVGAKLKVGTISQANSGTVPAGNVISQNPAAGTSVTQGSSVDLVISIGSLMVTVPNVVGMTQAAAGSAITAAGLTVGAVTTSYSNTVTTGDVISQSPGGGFSIPQGYEVDLVISLGHWSEPLPPDPGTVAPPIDPTVATNVATATEFLYTGANPIQTGVAPGTIDSKRVAVLRGKVLNRNGQALPGVTITILSHPEFGQTLSRLDGMFDLVVNGGGYLTVHYQKAGYLSAQRQVNAPWQDYAWLPDVILTQLDNQVTPIDLTSNEPIQIARGSVVTDDDGTRQATLLIPQGTQAQMVFADGSTQPLTTLSVRATEYTIGPNGPKAMPAELPPTSGYTYAVELSADEALSAGATAVSLNQPLYFYVEDFIGFPVGGAVPTGYYDRQKGQWIASDNGRVIQILGITGGLANIDTNGDGTPDDAATLAALNITDTERQRLAILYPQTPKQLWRVPMTHFTPWDCNWPYGPPLDAEPPKQGPPRQDTKMDDFTIECRSLVECQNQVLRERVTITGTPFTLSYSSAMVPGRESHILDIPLSGDTLPTSLMRIDLQIDVAGRLFSESFSPQSNLTYHFAWYGLEDAYGRRLQGVQQATVRIDYVYPAVYYPVWADMELSFGRMGPSTTFINSRAATTITVQQTWSLTLGESPIASQVGGWTLSAHHVYDPGARILHLGNGRRVSAQGVTTTGVINTVAGTGIPNNSSEPNYNGDGIPATQANLNIYWATGIAISPDGIIYIADTLNYRVRRISPDGIITTIAGTGSPGYNGDGIPATEAQLYWPMGVAIMSDGSLYISDFASPWGYEVSRVRRVGLDGIITTVAGGGSEWPGDGRPATEAGLSIPAKIALGPDGSLYIVENWGSGGAGYRVRRVGPDGIITTVAGTGERGYNGDGIPATQAMLYNPYDVAVGSDGSLYIADSGNNRVRRVGPDGIITTVAGDGSGWFHGDGGLATEAGVAGPAGVAVGPDGNLYIGDGHRVVRKVGSDGIITTVAGSGSNWDFYYHGDGTPATQANLPSPYTVAVGPDGSLYILDHGLQRLFKVSPVFPGFSLNNIAIPSEDGGEVYEFTPGGRHLRTLNALTGAVLYEFTYDSNGLLIQTKNIDGGNITTIERNAEGNPIAIVGPYGQRTALTLDANGYLAEIRNPAGESLHFVYSSGGLLKEMTDAKGNRSVYDYDTLGRLVKDTDAAGGSLSLARTDTLNGFDVTTATGLGKVTTHRVEDLSAGGMSMVDTYQDGTIVQKEIGTDGVRTITMSDGTVASLTQGPDPRFGMQAPIVTNTSLKTPSGLEKITTVERTATLSDPSNRLSLQTLTDNVNINGRLYTNIIDMGTMQRTLTTPEGRKLVTTFDARGRIIKKQFGNLNPISYTYDTRGRMSTITRGIDAEARGFAITYNNQGYPATISGPLSANVSLEYDAAGRVLRQILGDGRTIAFGYDAAGNIASITPPGKPSHLFTYSSINLAQEYTAPDAGTGPNVTALSFDLDKKLTSIMRPDGSAVTMSYDSAGRPATKSFPQGTLTYGYDPVTGVLSSLTAPDGGVLSMKYDGYLNTKSTWTGAVTGTVDRVYDNNFSLTRRSVNGQAIDFSYDDDGLLVQAGALTLTRDIANGFVIGTALGGVNDTWHYTGFGELDEYQATYNSGDYFTAQYTYDKLGRIVQKTEEIIGMGSNVYGYSYDVTSRLTGVSLNGGNIAAYIYDSNGNRLTFLSPSTTITGSYDAQDRLTQYGDITYTYTANGELASKRDAGGTTTYQYDALGNLTEVTLPSGTAIKYVIDGANRRIGKKVNNVLINGLLYKDDLKPVAELDAANNVVLRFVYGSRINAPDYMIKGGNTYRIISDHLGSPRLVVDVATGQITQRLDYDEFGRVLVDTNPGFQPFGFAGGLYDPDTGFVRFGARDYDPQTGRWTTKDPVLFSGKSLNLYAYALNNPVNLSDADGLKYGPGDINKSFAGPAEALQEPAPGSVERTEQGNGNYMEYGKTKDGIDFERACENGTCLERTWDPLTETFGEAMTSYDCEGSGCSDLTKKAEKENADFDPRNPFPGESLPPAQPVTPSPSLDLPPLVPIPLPSDKSCRLNIWRDASGNIINVIKVK